MVINLSDFFFQKNIYHVPNYHDFFGILQQLKTEKNTGCFLGDLKMSYGLRLLKIK